MKQLLLWWSQTSWKQSVLQSYTLQTHPQKHAHTTAGPGLPAPSVKPEFLWVSLHSSESKSESNLKGNSAAGWLLQPPAMHPSQLAHSNSFNSSGVSLAARWLHPSLADEAHRSHKSAGLVRFNCRPEPPLILWVSQHGKDMPPPSLSLFNTKIYAIAVFHTQTQCHNAGRWQYINTHINGWSGRGMPSTQ